MFPNRFKTTTIVLSLAMVTLWPGAVPAAPISKEKPSEIKVKWEYKVIAEPDVEQFAPKEAPDKLTGGLNALGEQGWELAAVMPSTEAGGIQLRIVGPLPGMPGGAPAVPPGGGGGAGRVRAHPVYLFKRAK